MPKQIYVDDDQHFYLWWVDIYKDEMQLYERWCAPGLMFDHDYKRWGILRAYFKGLVHGRNRVTSRP
jgi:hypothetical protein